MSSLSMTWAVGFNRLPQIAAGMDGKADRIVAKTAREIERGAKRRAAVDTGTMKNSIQAIRVGMAHWKVVVGAHYGVYVEFGTRYMRAQPFLWPAAIQARPSFLAAMKRVVA